MSKIVIGSVNVFITLILTGFIFFADGCSQPKKNNERERMKLYGKVKSLKEISYLAVVKPGLVEKGKPGGPVWKKDVHIFFSESGRKTEEDYLRKDGGLRYKSLFFYDKKGNKVEEKAYKPDGKLWYNKYSVFDNNGKIIAEKLFKGDSLVNKWVYKYDTKGNKIDEERYLSDEQHLSIRVTYQYDEKGNKIEETMYNREGGLIVKWISKYNIHGMQIEEKYLNAAGVIEATESYQYVFDKPGNWIQQIVYEDGQPKYIVERVIEYY